MKLFNHQDSKAAYISFHHREWSIDVEFKPNQLLFTFKYDNERKGAVEFELNEIHALLIALRSFFVDGKRGKALNGDAATFTSAELPLLKISTTNWGEPFSQGLRFELSENFTDYTLDNLYFDLEEFDAKSLIKKLEEWDLNK